MASYDRVRFAFLYLFILLMSQGFSRGGMVNEPTGERDHCAQEVAVGGLAKAL